MSNPYLKRHITRVGSPNSNSIATGSPNVLRNFWDKNKTIIIGATAVVIAVPITVKLYRKVTGSGNEAVAQNEPQLEIFEQMILEEPGSSNKDEEVVLEEEESWSEPETDYWPKPSEQQQPVGNHNKNDTTIQFSESDFDISPDDTAEDLV